MQGMQLHLEQQVDLGVCQAVPRTRNPLRLPHQLRKPLLVHRLCSQLKFGQSVHHAWVRACSHWRLTSKHCDAEAFNMCAPLSEVS